MLKLLETLKKFFIIPSSNRLEFNQKRALYNRNTLFYACLALIPCFFVLFLIGKWSGESDGSNPVFSSVNIYLYAIIICVSVCAVLFVVDKLKEKIKNKYIIVVDIICSIAYTSFILLFLLIYNNQVQNDTTAQYSARVDIFIILLFSIVFITKFSCLFTIGLQFLYTVAINIWLILIKDKIVNFEASIINLDVAFIFAFISTCSLWIASKRDFFNAKNLEALISSDFLTRLKNRRGFDVYLNGIWAKSAKNNMSLTMFMIDIDNFKQYNDTFGHVEGDNCLCAVANVIAGCLRRDDFAARYGGEEFAVLMLDCDRTMSLAIANRILEKLKELNLPHPKNVVPYVSASIGIAIASPASQETDMIEFVRNADTAMYRAKEKGRNSIVFYHDKRYYI